MTHYNPQQTKIIELCKDRAWHCQKEFQPISWCAHKRRAEIEKKKEYVFLKRDCEHGIKGSNDWIMAYVIKEKPEKKEEKTLFPSYPKLSENHKRWTQ